MKPGDKIVTYRNAAGEAERTVTVYAVKGEEVLVRCDDVQLGPGIPRWRVYALAVAEQTHLRP